MPSGICINISHSCSKALHYEIQEADYGHDFVCAECGCPLSPYRKSEPLVHNRKANNSDSSRNSPILKAAIAAAIFLVSGTVLYALFSPRTSIISHGNDMAIPELPSKPSITESNPAPATAQSEGFTSDREADLSNQSEGSGLKRDSSETITIDIVAAEDHSGKQQTEGAKNDTPDTHNPKSIFGDCASLSHDGIITFEKSYRLDLQTRDGEILRLSPGDRIIDPIIRNNRLRAGYLITKNGKEKRYISGLDNPI